MHDHVKLLAVGDATKDVFINIEEATVSCTLNTEACLLCLNYADKIPVKSVVQVRAAGNAANAAVGTRRLGHTSALLTILGDDDDGHELQEALRHEKVDHRFVQFDKKHATNYSTVLNFKGERTILIHHEPRTYCFPKKVPHADWVYYTTLGEGHERLEKGLLAYLKRHPNTKLLFNPGVFQLRRGRKALNPVLKRSTILIVNKHEAELLLEERQGHEMPNLLMRLHDLGSDIVIITDGPRGSCAYTGKEMWSLGVFPGKAKERTGAGDAYATGLVNGLVSKKSLPEAMRWGTANAWSVIRDIGPQKGLLDAAGMKKTLSKFLSIKAVRINHFAKR